MQVLVHRACQGNDGPDIFRFRLLHFFYSLAASPRAPYLLMQTQWLCGRTLDNAHVRLVFFFHSTLNPIN